MKPRTPESMGQLINRYTGINKGWKIVHLGNKQVDLPQMPAITFGSIADILTDSQSAMQQLEELKIEKARSRRSVGIQKEAITSESEKHTVTIEQGQLPHDHEEYQEMELVYEYTNDSWRTVITVSNRDPYSLRRYSVPFGINVNRVNEKSETPKEGFNYNFNQHGVNNAIVGTIPDNGMYITSIDYVHDELEPLALFIPGVDIRRQNLKPMETLEKLLENINSDSPADPVSVLIFEDKNDLTRIRT